TVGVVAVGLLVVQQLGLAWLTPGPSALRLDEIARATRRNAERAATLRRRSAGRSPRQTFSPGSYGLDDYYEREMRERNELRERGLDRYYEREHSDGPLGLLTRSLAPAAATTANLRATRSTGLVPDVVWPRIELILPPAVRRDFKRTDRIIAALRVAVASAVS